MINDDITIVVVEIRGDKVRLGVEAPPAVPVHRQEVYDSIKKSGDHKEVKVRVPGWPSYVCTSDGRVFEKHESKKAIQLPQTLMSPDGRKQIRLTNSDNLISHVVFVDELVLAAFGSARPPGPSIVRFINGDFGDTRIENLEWSICELVAGPN